MYWLRGQFPVRSNTTNASTSPFTTDRLPCDFFSQRTAARPPTKLEEAEGKKHTRQFLTSSSRDLRR